MSERILLAIMRFFLNRRYRVEWKGLEQLKAGENYLFLPNHPAEVDPLILLDRLWPRAKSRPVILKQFYRYPIISLYCRLFRAIPLSDLEGDQSKSCAEDVNAALDLVIDALAAGDSILFYPSGRLMRGGFERLQGASGAFSLIKKGALAKVYLIKTSGLYGSLSSTAPYLGQRPNPISAALRALFLLLAYGIWFMPKRQVVISIEPASNQLLAANSKQVFNELLEKWYNDSGPELASSNLIKLPNNPDAERQPKLIGQQLRPELWEPIKSKLAEISSKEPELIKPEALLRDELGLDSLQLVELAQWLKEEYGCRAPRIKSLKVALDPYLLTGRSSK